MTKQEFDTTDFRKGMKFYLLSQPDIVFEISGVDFRRRILFHDYLMDVCGLHYSGVQPTKK